MIADEPRIARHVALRPMTADDLPTVVRWRASAVSARYAGWDNPQNCSCRLEGQYVTAIMDPEGENAWHFVLETDGVPVGTLCYREVDHTRHSCQVEILLADPDGWERGPAEDGLRRLLSILFGTCEMRRVWLTVNAEDRRALSFYRRVGFQKEGVLREAEPFEGRYANAVLLSLLASEWGTRQGGAAWETSPLRPEEVEWFVGLAPASGCDPHEIHDALAHDEIHVWRCGSRPAAFAALAWRKDEAEVHILAVDPAFRRQGVATRVLLSIREQAERRGLKRLRLVTSNDNTPAIHMYQKVGFRMAALYPGRPERRRGYVLDGYDGLPVRDDIEMVWTF